MCCGGLHAWWSTQSQLAAFLSSLVACRQIGPLLYNRSVLPGDCLQFVIVVFPDHTHLLLYIKERDGA